VKALIAVLMLTAACGGGAISTSEANASREIEDLCHSTETYLDVYTGKMVTTTPCQAYADFVAACDVASESDAGAALTASCFNLADDGGRELATSTGAAAYGTGTRACRPGGFPTSVNVATVRTCCCF